MPPFAPNPASKWRIITPCLLLPFLAPSLVLAYACATNQGPWAADGYFGPGTRDHLAPTLVLLIPLAVWAASWLFNWEGFGGLIEARTITAVTAVALCVVICAAFAFFLWLSAGFQGWGQAV